MVDHEMCALIGKFGEEGLEVRDRGEGDMQVDGPGTERFDRGGVRADQGRQFSAADFLAHGLEVDTHAAHALGMPVPQRRFLNRGGVKLDNYPSTTRTAEGFQGSELTAVVVSVCRDLHEDEVWDLETFRAFDQIGEERRVGFIGGVWRQGKVDGVDYMDV